MVRPRGRGARRPQQTFFESDITEHQPELKAALEQREAAKTRLGEAKHNFKVADDRVAPLIAALDLGDGAAVRVGDFVITAKMSKASPVEFTRQAKLRTRIKSIAEE